MNYRFWPLLDRVAHALYLPTALGRPQGQVRWHHRIHLIPDRLAGWICDRYDLWLGVTDEELNRRANQA